jgi:glycerol dehydrogenase
MNAQAKSMTVTGARFPGRYVQGPGVLSRLGDEVALLGQAGFAILDGSVFGLFEPMVRAACPGITLIRHLGECSGSEIARLQALATSAGVIIGMGGGKALDTAKAVAHHLRKPLIVVPTIAASDAPCSALAVVYTDEGKVAFDMFLPRNPDLVLADTAIIVSAPARFLAAGIGDALATWYEAESCRKSGVPNFMGTRPVSLVHAISRLCLDAVLEFGPAALAECDAKTPGPALERVVEANILLSGVGFESCGVAGAHAIHHGLCELDDVHHHLHGEKVTIGVLATLLMQGREVEFLETRAFCARVRLPVRLSDIGIHDATDGKLAIVAARACRPGEIMHNEPDAMTEAMVIAALKRLI